MDNGHIKNLQSFHVIFLVQNVMVGMKLLTLPHDMSGAGYNQWWVVILMGLIAQLTLFPIYWICIRYPDQNLYTINELLLGKWLGKAINLLIVLYPILGVSSVSESYIRLVQTVTLPDKTFRMPMFALFVAVIYIALGGIKSIARFCMISFFFTAWMAYYVQWGFQKGTITHLLPLFNVTTEQVVHAISKGYPAMLGYELMLIYFPYIRNQERALKHASVGLWIAVFFYLVVSITSVIYFSRWQLESLVYPVLNLFKAVELSFVERIENFGIAIWVFLILSTTSAYLWAAKTGIDSLLAKRRVYYLYVAAVIAMIPNTEYFSVEWRKNLLEGWAEYLGYGVILWPNFLLVIHGLKQRIGGRKA